MNTKNIKHFLLAGMVCCGVSTAITSCSDWDDHYESNADMGASGSNLWQQIQSNPQLSDFREVLEKTKVYRMHKKTPVSYADMLSSGQAFTVMAPLNGTFNKDSLLNLVETVVGDSSVEKSFVQNHLTRSLVSIKPEPARLMMLNQKRLNIADGKVDGVTVTEANNHAGNGVLHILQRALNYKHNLFEMFCDNPELEAIGANLRRFNTDEFLPEASVQNGVIEGVPVYVDSVVIEKNRLLEEIGLLKDEDSTYVVVAPTIEGWNEIWEEASNYFQYEESMEKRDSLQQYYTIRALLEDGIFNMTDQKSPNDSLISVPYLKQNRTYTNNKYVYHVFRDPFSEGGILYGAKPIKCSNGTIYTTDKWSFTPEQTYFKELFVEAEGTHLITDYNKCVLNQRQLAADSIFEGKYLRIAPLLATDNWDVTFQVDNTLSGSYDIYAVVLPKSVYDQTDPDQRPCKFKATISYLDKKGKIQKFDCVNEEGKAEFLSDPEKIDRVLLAKNFKFPTCSYGQNGVRVTIKLTCSITARQTSSYAREMFLDCIYLKPHTSKSE